MTPIKGELVDARDVLPGDWIILPTLGAHFVDDVETFDEETGTDPGPRVRIIYRAGMTVAYENRARAAKGPSHTSSSVNVTAGTKPYKPSDRVAITRRDA